MGVYIKGVTKQELKEIFSKARILYNSADLVDVETPLIPDKIERGSVTMICDAVIIHCDDYFDMMLKSTAIDNGSWERFITNETKRGEWIIDNEQKTCTCSECNIVWDFSDEDGSSNFCSHCGTDMRKGIADEH